MQQYYSLERSQEEVFPQIDFLNQKSVHSLTRDNLENIDFTYRLEKGARKTSFMSQATIRPLGMVVSKEIIDLLTNQLVLCPSKITAIDNEYFWLLFDYVLEDFKWLDYRNSSFFYTEFGMREGEINLESYEDCRVKMKELGTMSTIEVERFQLTPDFKYDVFVIPLLSRKIFVTEKAFKLFSNTELTGLSLKKI